MAQPAKQRILCVHGHGQSAEKFRAKTAAIRSAFKKSHEFVYVDGPVDVPPCEHSDEWEKSWIKRGEPASPEAGLAALAEMYVQQGPFAGVFGFSLGAAMTVLLAHHFERVVGTRAPAPKFVVVVSGFLLEESYEPRIEPSVKLEMPSLHVYGTGDAIIPAERSQKAMEVFSAPTVVVHDGGHFVPSSLRKDLKEFFAKIDAE